MGCLRLVPGSHKLGRVSHKESPEALHPFVDLAEFGYTEDDVLAIETEPGDLIVWHQDMFHGSPPNAGTEPRIAIAAVYHGRSEEDQLMACHRSGAIRSRPQLCAGDKILPLHPITTLEAIYDLASRPTTLRQNEI